MATPKSSNGKSPSNGAGKQPAKANAAKGLHELFEDQLKDIYWAEKALTKALPKMIKNATSAELKSAFTDHLDVTEEQVARCEEVFESIGKKATASKCEAMEGLIKEAEEIMESTEPGSVRDAGLICAAQKVEHYEIATYGTLVSWANQLGESEAAGLLEATLNEEKEADVTLTEIAEASVNEEAEDREEDDNTPTMTKSKRIK
jgi:ferritin-like metal-binding protein YciE